MGLCERQRAGLVCRSICGARAARRPAGGRRKRAAPGSVLRARRPRGRRGRARRAAAAACAPSRSRPPRHARRAERPAGAAVPSLPRAPKPYAPSFPCPRRVGSGEALGACRRSCGACAACAKGDVTCYNQNRRRLGYLEVEESERSLFPAMDDVIHDAR